MNMKRPDRLHSLESVRSCCIWPAFLHCAAAGGGMRLRRGGLRSVCVWCAFGLRGSGGVFCIGLCPAFTVLARRLPRLTPAVCRMATNRTACDILRFYSAGSRSPFARSRGVVRLSAFCGFTLGLCVYLRRSRRVTGVRGTENGATGSAARPLCVFAQPHWRSESFRGEYAGAARPKPAPKSLRLSGLSSGAGRVRECVSRGGARVVRV